MLTTQKMRLITSCPTMLTKQEQVFKINFTVSLKALSFILILFLNYVEVLGGAPGTPVYRQVHYCPAASLAEAHPSELPIFL